MGLTKLVKDFYSRITADKKKQPLTNCGLDAMKINLPGLDMSMKRYIDSDIPYEVSMFVPRAEIRKTIEENGKKTSWEILLNSITIVHAPRHKPLGETPLKEPPEPPKPPPEVERKRVRSSKR